MRPGQSRVDSRSLTRRLGDAARAAFVPERQATTLLLLICIPLLALGVGWRMAHWGYPNHFTFDEDHFVENARNYMQRKADWNDHPPLGKLILVPGMLAFGDTSAIWRLPSLVIGLLLIVVSYFTATGLFRDKRAGLLAAAFVSADGLFISYSRTALLDTPMATMMLLAFYLMANARNLRWFWASAVMLGLAVSVKWTSGCLFLMAPLLLISRRRSPWHAAWMLGVVAITYLGIFWAALLITKQPAGLGVIVKTNWELLKHHAAFTDWNNTADSRWYTWPFLTHPILLHFAREPDGRIRAMSTVGNPVLWYGVTAGFIVALFRVSRAAVRAWWKSEPFPTITRHCGLLLGTAAALLVPWYFTNRESYIWHYFASYFLGVVLLAGMLIDKAARFRWPVFTFVSVVAAVSILYSPVWTNTRLSDAAFHLRFLPWSFSRR